jgi:hydroxyacylglutathione hydrolase
MHLEMLTVGPASCTCSIVACKASGLAAVIDPGGNADRILTAVAQMGVTVKYLLHTHGHFDHILATAEMSHKTGASILIHRDDLRLYDNLPAQCQMFGLSAERPPAPTQLLSGGETITIGDLEARVLHTPGHTPGSVGYYFPNGEAILFAGDTLFAESVGRTDLPGGSFPALVTSIREKLYTLPGVTRVIPGHGPETTIAHELEHNPFVSAKIS